MWSSGCRIDRPEIRWMRDVPRKPCLLYKERKTHEKGIRNLLKIHQTTQSLRKRSPIHIIRTIFFISNENIFFFQTTKYIWKKTLGESTSYFPRLKTAFAEVIVFPRKTLFEQLSDVTELQVSGHEVLGWWVVAKEETRPAWLGSVRGWWGEEMGLESFFFF